MKVLECNLPGVGGEKDPWVMARLRSPLGTAILAIFVVTVSYLSGWLAENLVLSRQVVSAIYTGNALLVPILLLVSRRTWPLLILADILGAALHGLQVGLTPRMLVLIITGATVENLIAAFGLQYCFNSVPRLNTLKGVCTYFLVAVLLAPLVGSSIGAVAMQGYYWTNWRMWYFSEALAFATITPAILSWVSIRTGRPRGLLPFLSEFALLLGSLVLLSCLVAFVHWKINPAALLFCFVPFLLWAALRFGSLGVSSSMVAIMFLFIWGNVHGLGPFMDSDPFHSVQSLQLFLVSAAIPFMVLAALIEEREGTHQTVLDLNHKLIAAHEQERSRIARELHDDICQRLAMLSIRIEKVNKMWDGGHMAVSGQLTQIWSQCSELTGDVQALSHELHPSILDNLGLIAAIKSFCREISDQSGGTVDFIDRDVPGNIPQDLSLSLFRIVQEALHNAVKYSGAKQFGVYLQGKPGEIELEVSDSGMGFDVTKVKNKGGLGITNMAERVHLVNGTFHIDSQANQGTRIRVRLPFGPQRNVFSWSTTSHH
jgi:signal transduction histidine kinase